MPKQKREQLKAEFKQALIEFVETFKGHISTSDDQWTIKGFIDVFRNIYTISADTKIVSKILEIHLFPKLLEFASQNNYRIVLAEQQNYYPDLSFVKADDETIKMEKLGIFQLSKISLFIVDKIPNSQIRRRENQPAKIDECRNDSKGPAPEMSGYQD